MAEPRPVRRSATLEPATEADLLEQQRALDPTPVEPEPAPDTERLGESADEADWLEQQMPVPGLDEDYPQDSADLPDS